ncbi:hypothetical protein cce_1275 [Crocosphaera subtropica ATCC 51142]|uniref:Uncharacterized protein n=1 Tax=Crocosphaera subtropica (strain ATCC 51142 / BH68) TaxID=43989 RepID=B1WVN8_CROS5|nr:hypothetical protein cce_1275 [Crocosphaera subtropica ATCC 51142]
MVIKDFTHQHQHFFKTLRFNLNKNKQQKPIFGYFIKNTNQ